MQFAQKLHSIEEMEKNRIEFYRRFEEDKMYNTEYENGVLICCIHKTPISKSHGRFFCLKCSRNAAARAKNQILCDICGTVGGGSKTRHGTIGGIK